MFASKQTGFFYDPGFNDFIPDDAVKISPEAHAELLAGQGEGKVIGWNQDGFPRLELAPEPSPEQLAMVERAWRDLQLTGTDSVVTRHRDELEEGSPTSLTAKQYAELQAYRRQLRDWPEAGEFPLSEHRPQVPAWLPESTQ